MTTADQSPGPRGTWGKPSCVAGLGRRSWPGGYQEAQALQGQAEAPGSGAWGLGGLRLCISFLRWSQLALGLGKAEPAGEGHGQGGLSSRGGAREPDVSRPRVTLEEKTRDF